MTVAGPNHWAKFVGIEYADCTRCDHLLFMAVRRGHMARWQHDRGAWEIVWHRPQPVPCGGGSDGDDELAELRERVSAIEEQLQPSP